MESAALKLRKSLAVSNFESCKERDRIHFLKTGSSDAILIESNGHFALIDAAEDNDNPRGFEELDFRGYEQEVLAYLKENAADENGIVHLDFVLGTHSHSDHIGGFDTIILDDNVVIDKAFLKVYKEEEIRDKEVNDWDNKEVYQQMVDALNSKSIPIVSKMNNAPFMLGNFRLTLFNTEDCNTEKVGENDNSLGVLVEKAGARIFLSGDIDNVSKDEERLAPQIGEIDILKVGHHSYRFSTEEVWLKTLSPKVCVVTNDFERLDMRTIGRIEDMLACPILVTGTENGIVVSVDNSGVIRYYNEIM